MKVHYRILAIDLDGTIAEHDQVSTDTWEALHRAKQAGFTILLVTGRRMEALQPIRPFEDLCEAVIAENGAAIYYSGSHTVMLPFGTLAPEVLDLLSRAEIPFEKGMAIWSTWIPHDKVAVEILSKTGYACTIEYNKGAVMLLPPGATKGTGLLAALHEMGYSPRNVIAMGDGENDRSLFEQSELSVAVSNAKPEIKEIADIVLEKPNGAGVRGFIDKLIASELPMHLSREKKLITLGKRMDGSDLIVHPDSLLNNRIGIFGSSGSGKSWLGGLLAEELLHLKYQICIIDPEGDYRNLRAFSHTLLLGGSEEIPPPGSFISTLAEYSDVNLVLDLSTYDQPQKCRYVYELLKTLFNLRDRKGIPHWFLIDEAQYFCAADQGPIRDLLLEQSDVGGIALVSYQPSLISPEVMATLDSWMITKMSNPGEMAVLRTYLNDEDLHLLDDQQFSNMTNSEVYISSKNGIGNSGMINFSGKQRVLPHIRHLHKYLRAPLPDAKRFYFKQSGKQLSASSLWDFCKMVSQVSPKVLKYHLDEGHFEKWIREVLHDEELARRLRKIKNRALEGAFLVHALHMTLSSRFTELEQLI